MRSAKPLLALWLGPLALVISIRAQRKRSRKWFLMTGILLGAALLLQSCLGSAGSSSGTGGSGGSGTRTTPTSAVSNNAKGGGDQPNRAFSRASSTSYVRSSSERRHRERYVPAATSVTAQA